MSDERRRELARLAGNGDLEALRHLVALFLREGQDVVGVLASVLGFTSDRVDAFRALRNHPMVKSTVDIVSRERALWVAGQLRGITANRTLTDRTRVDIDALARRIEQQRYPDFFEEWAAINQAVHDAVPTRGRSMFPALLAAQIPLSPEQPRNPSQDPSADLQNRSEPMASPLASSAPSDEVTRAP